MRKRRLSTTIHRCNRVLLALTVVLLAPLCGQVQTYSSEQLFKMGQDAYNARNYVDAAVYLYAYMQKTPDLGTTQPQHAAEVQKAYEYSVDKARSAVTERDSLKKQLASAPHDDRGSTTAGLEMPPPPLHGPRNQFAMAEFVNTVAGVWKYEMVSDEGGGVHQGMLTINLRKSDVSGEMDTWDNSARSFTGSWNNGVLELVRDTGLETVQKFKIGIKGNTGKGTFRNDGRYPDSGSITLSR
jgi:hypothetical protein